MQKKTLLGALYLSIAASIWGGMFVVVKLVVGTFQPLTLVWLRYSVALLTLLVIKWLTHETWHWHRQDWPLLIGIGLIGNLISIVTQETGTWLANAQLGAVITASTPTFMLLFGAWLLKERLTWLKVGTVSLATLGILLIVGVQAFSRRSLLGAICLVIAALTWALMSVLVKLVPSSYSPLQVTTVATATAWICLTPFIIHQRHHIAWQALGQVGNLSGILYLGIISTALAFVLWNHGLQFLNAATSGLFFAWQPIVGTLLGWLVLGEPISLGFLLGSCLVLISIWLNTRYS